MGRGMKIKKIHSSFHFIYGVIIGILICACTGQTTSETESPISYSDTMDVRVVGWKYNVKANIDADSAIPVHFGWPQEVKVVS